MAAVDTLWIRTELPYLKPELAVTVDHFKVGAVRRDQSRAMRSGYESDQHVKMQIAQLGSRKPVIRLNSSKYLTRVQPVLFRGSQDWMIPSESPQEPQRNFGRDHPKFRSAADN